MIKPTALLVLAVLMNHPAAAVNPDQLEFRRQAVRRMIFDKSQDIPLAGLWPSRIVGLEVMHPPVGEQLNAPAISLENGRLRIAAKDSEAVSTRWVGGFNPFASYDVAVHQVNGSGEVGLMFGDTAAANRIVATLVVVNGEYRSVRHVIVKDGMEVDRQEFALPDASIRKAPIRLRAQMVAVGANLYVERDDVSTLIGRVDFAQ
jgi:hypothetical protein